METRHLVTTRWDGPLAAEDREYQFRPGLDAAFAQLHRSVPRRAADGHKWIRPGHPSDDLADRRRQVSSLIVQEQTDTVIDQGRNAAAGGGYHRNARGHRLEDDEWLGFIRIAAGKHQNIDSIEETGLLFAVERAVIRDGTIGNRGVDDLPTRGIDDRPRNLPLDRHTRCAQRRYQRKEPVNPFFEGDVAKVSQRLQSPLVGTVAARGIVARHGKQGGVGQNHRTPHGGIAFAEPPPHVLTQRHVNGTPAADRCEIQHRTKKAAQVGEAVVMEDNVQAEEASARHKQKIAVLTATARDGKVQTGTPAIRRCGNEEAQMAAKKVQEPIDCSILGGGGVERPDGVATSFERFAHGGIRDGEAVHRGRERTDHETYAGVWHPALRSRSPSQTHHGPA